MRPQLGKLGRNLGAFRPRAEQGVGWAVGITVGIAAVCALELLRESSEPLPVRIFGLISYLPIVFVGFLMLWSLISRLRTVVVYEGGIRAPGMFGRVSIAWSEIESIQHFADQGLRWLRLSRTAGRDAYVPLEVTTNPEFRRLVAAYAGQSSALVQALEADSAA